MLFTFNTYQLKRKIESTVIYPLVLLGKLLGRYVYKLKSEYDVFFFFPFYHTGGAEKIHAQIAKVVSDKKTIIFFTRKSVDETFLQAFKQSGAVIKNISEYTDNKWLYFRNIIYRGIVSEQINSQNNRLVVFNGQCNFAYKISPWINKNIKQIELIHSFNSFSLIRIPFLPFISRTIMISKVQIQKHYEQYKRLYIPSYFNEKIQYITNAANVPDSYLKKQWQKPYTVLYVGRGTEEKRVDLIAEIANDCSKLNIPVCFKFMGDVKNAISQNYLKDCILLGTVNDNKIIEQNYQHAHFLIIVSSTEGMPLTIIEGMANGCIIMATPVGDIPYYIEINKNGLLFSTSVNRKKIKQEAIDFLKSSINNVNLCKMSELNYHTAVDNFSIDKFKNSYRSIILE